MEVLLCFPSAWLCNVRHDLLISLLFWFNLVLLLFLVVSHQLDISLVKLLDQLLSSALLLVCSYVKRRAAGWCSWKTCSRSAIARMAPCGHENIGGNLDTFTPAFKGFIQPELVAGHKGIVSSPCLNSWALFICTSGPGTITSGWFCAYLFGRYPAVFSYMKLRQMPKTLDFKGFS